MDLKLRGEDRLRIETSQQKAFVDVAAVGYEGIAVMGYPRFQYVEVRMKEGQLVTFYFPTKRHKKEACLGWWNDAEVVYAVNEVNK